MKICYYTAPLNQKSNKEEYQKQQKFFGYLTKIDKLDLFFGRLEKRPNGNPVEKGVDVKLAVDLLSGAYNDRYDVAVLVSNDADFVPAITEAQKLNKVVHVVSFPNSRSYHLRQICDRTIKINDISPFLRTK
jgi:uncharacterized LabA/DUF88 family protein